MDGISGIKSVAAQHVPGYPARGQVIYYIGIPLAALAVSIAWPSWQLVRKRKLGWRVATATLCLLPMYMFYYTGGV